MLKIGVTGGIGSGKTHVADLFAALGAAVVDADVVAHAVTAAGGAAIPGLLAEFGPACLTADGALNRDWMRTQAFAAPGVRQRLEAVVHPLVRTALAEQVAALSTQPQIPYLLIVVPLLIESGGWRDRVDRVLVVDCPVALQIERVIARSGLTRDAVEAIIAAQASRAQRLAAADDVIDNGGLAAATQKRVRELDLTYRSLNGQANK